MATLGYELPAKMLSRLRRAFAAILEDDSVVAWGPHFQGGELPEKHAELMKRQGVVAIQGNEGAFAAVLKGGDVWGPSFREEHRLECLEISELL